MLILSNIYICRCRCEGRFRSGLRGLRTPPFFFETQKNKKYLYSWQVPWPYLFEFSGSTPADGTNLYFVNPELSSPLGFSKTFKCQCIYPQSEQIKN